MVDTFNSATQSRLLTTLRKKAFENKAFENVVGKGENAGKQHFLLFPQCFFFLPYQHKFQFLAPIYFVVCKCHQFGQV